ncbi:hypothetical protein KUCAC02_007409 [Chaenocephalus aceratus]|uniref:Uncharacterized protein n=1 Tax=Chaenocephalus aceratus TaxID=36190 RepID=A0ACB9X5E3_CHAAC|nr:hypothetical protein KUCAC02_007409 [Chaenocephalus aceratus]
MVSAQRQGLCDLMGPTLPVTRRLITQEGTDTYHPISPGPTQRGFDQQRAKGSKGGSQGRRRDRGRGLKEDRRPRCYRTTLRRLMSQIQ